MSSLSEVIQHSLCSCWKNKPEATVWIQVDQSSPAKKGPALPQMQTSLISHRYSFEMSSRTRVGWVKVLRCTKCQRQKKTNIKLKGEVWARINMIYWKCFIVLAHQNRRAKLTFDSTTSLIFHHWYKQFSQHRYLQLKCQPVSIFLPPPLHTLPLLECQCFWFNGRLH